MARRRKSIKIQEAENLPNIIAYKDGDIENRIKEFFGNNNPVVLEIGCGRGDYSVELAQRFPDKNFVGLDLKPARLWNGATKSLELELKNILFLYMNAKDLAEEIKTVKFSEIWITFPDPMPKKKQEKKRLLAPHYLDIYKKITALNSIIHLKTDDEGLYVYTLETLKELNIKIIKNKNDLYSERSVSEIESIKTKYELMHLAEGKKIKLIDFSFGE